MGPVVTDELDPWAGVGVETRVNGTIRQHGNSRDFIFPLDVVIRFISQVMTLDAGDLIPTGTPKGVGPVATEHGSDCGRNRNAEKSGGLRNVGASVNARVESARTRWGQPPRLSVRGL